MLPANIATAAMLDPPIAANMVATITAMICKRALTLPIHLSMASKRIPIAFDSARIFPIRINSGSAAREKDETVTHHAVDDQHQSLESNQHKYGNSIDGKKCESDRHPMAINIRRHIKFIDKNRYHSMIRLLKPF